jgi:hypothetical protein
MWIFMIHSRQQILPSADGKPTWCMFDIHRTNMWRCSKLLKVSCELMACRSLVCGTCFQSICLDGWVSQRVGRLRNMMLQHVALVYIQCWLNMVPTYSNVIAHWFRLMVKIRQNQKDWWWHYMLDWALMNYKHFTKSQHVAMQCLCDE